MSSLLGGCPDKLWCAAKDLGVLLCSSGRKRLRGRPPSFYAQNCRERTAQIQLARTRPEDHSTSSDAPKATKGPLSTGTLSCHTGRLRRL
ncbi:hypothetical protein V5799_002775 [Amblyomma americanum]|uniref:Uncharacterized protein n=1 Tax=Amblyomma americanum TaxID=6943 RepID=A0AAQ4DAV3_AMBAM